MKNKAFNGYEKIRIREVNNDVLYKCPDGNCGYEITLSELEDVTMTDAGAYCPCCGKRMLEIL